MKSIYLGAVAVALLISQLLTSKAYAPLTFRVSMLRERIKASLLSTSHFAGKIPYGMMAGLNCILAFRIVTGMFLKR